MFRPKLRYKINRYFYNQLVTNMYIIFRFSACLVHNFIAEDFINLIGI